VSRTLWGLALMVALAGCTHREKAPAPEAAAAGALLFLSADTRGYLGPCGCSENMRGGIARAAWQVLEARQGPRPVLYVDGGDSLFGQAALKPERAPQEERKARALAEAMRRMGLAVRAVGELDEARGADFRRSLGLPELAAGEVRLLEAGGRSVGVLSASSPEQLVEAAARARAQGAHFVLALFHGTVEAAQQAAATPGLEADLVVATHSESELEGEHNRLVRGGVPVAAVQSKGRSLLRVELAYGPGPSRFALQRSSDDTEQEVAALEERVALLDKEINLPGMSAQLKRLKQGKREELAARRQALLTAPLPSAAREDSFTVRFLPLEPQLPAHAEALAVVAAYDADVGRMNLAWAREHGQDCPPAEPGRPAFAGNAACAECHAEAFPVWEQSKHHHAWETLEEVGKQFHLDCIGCHVTGWERAGGVCRLDRVAGREDVGCESCHGPGSLHVEDPAEDNILARPGEAQCVGCHNRENSPHFDFATYLPRVLGPGHGQPAESKVAH
jgi:uncharacterized small protein (DUF1192 family)